MSNIVKAFLVFLVSLLVFITGCRNTNSSIIVMTYNIHHGAGTDKKFDLERIASIIAKESADIVALNEVDNNFADRSEFADIAAVLAEKLNMEYAYGANLITAGKDKPGEYGNAILAKHKILSSKNHKLYRHATEEPRGCLHANILIGNDVYNVFAVHLDRGRERLIRENQTKDLCKLIAGKNKVIFTGDLNATVDEEDSPIMLIKQKMTDSYNIANNDQYKGTIKSGRRIDYIFVTPDLGCKVVKYKVIRNSVTDIASDHWPVVVEIKQ